MLSTLDNFETPAVALCSAHFNDFSVIVLCLLSCLPGFALSSLSALCFLRKKPGASFRTPPGWQSVSCLLGLHKSSHSQTFSFFKFMDKARAFHALEESACMQR